MNRPSDEQIETMVGLILRTGVTIAAAIVAAGGIAYLASHGESTPSYRVFHGAPAGLTSLGGILHGAATVDPLFLIQLGLIVLMATPVARVVACAAGFSLQKDWKYVVISIVVLGLLLTSLAGNGV